MLVTSTEGEPDLIEEEYQEIEGEEDDEELEMDDCENQSQNPSTSNENSIEAPLSNSFSKYEGADESILKKKRRITLGRGAACVTCSKCTGNKPCSNCIKSEIDCRYEEIQKRKPKTTLLEDRVAQLEAVLGLAPNEPLGDIKSRVSISFNEPFHSAPILPLKPSPASSSTKLVSPGPSSHASSSLNLPSPSPKDPTAASLSLHSYRDLPTFQTTVNGNNQRKVEILPHSQLERALIEVVLPHTPYLCMPLHPQRFLAQLTLATTDPGRPHPALLYILFAEAVSILEKRFPIPNPPRPPISLYPNWQPQTYIPPQHDTNQLLQHVQGMGMTFLERARSELDKGIRNVDRPFDLIRASIGISRYLYHLGRFIEGWNIPVTRLLISCGLHRMSGSFVSPDGDGVQQELLLDQNSANAISGTVSGSIPGSSISAGSGSDSLSGSFEIVPRINRQQNIDPNLPPPYPASHLYRSPSTQMAGPDGRKYPVTRMRPVIIPPARDEIELSERIMTFWAAKLLDWAAGCGWGWSLNLSDEECTTEWGWGWGSVEVKPPELVSYRFGIRDLHDPTSPYHHSGVPETTYTLAAKSLGLLHRATTLFDLPIASYPVPRPNGFAPPTHIPPLAAIQAVETAMQMFKQSIPPIFSIAQPHLIPVLSPQIHSQTLPHQLVSTPSTISPPPPLPNSSSYLESSQPITISLSSPTQPIHGQYESYDGPSDPWWIMLHINLLTAEMLLWKEKAHHVSGTYETAVRCARALVDLVGRIIPENWIHVDMIVALNLSLVSRFLFKEADRLRSAKQLQAAQMAERDAEILRQVLMGEYSKWCPMASLHGLIVQRVREGWSEKEGEWERV